MLFTSPLFLFLFLPVFIVVYYLSPSRFRNFVFLIASILFYAWDEWASVLILLLMILINYFLGLKISRSRFPLLLTVLAVIFDLSYIFYFKYLTFTLKTIFPLLTKFSFSPPVLPSIVMPLGISFVTFHLISYIVDVYRRTIKPETNVFHFMLYIFMFPHLIAGPIVRYSDIGLQIKKRSHSFELFSQGIYRFIIGLGKKIILANTLGAVADQIFGFMPQYLSAPIVWLALISYSLQIYFDFSGYSDMAIGLAKMFGFEFKENFNFPYLATSIQDFWRRWHISLSYWFRDYLYIPLGGNRRGLVLTLINILIVFALTGLWHGANWHFLFWGLYFGLFLVLENIFLAKLLTRLPIFCRYFYTLSVVILGWLFFRIDSLSYAFHLLKVMFGLGPSLPPVYSTALFLTPEYITIFIVAIFTAFSFTHRTYQKLNARFPVIAHLFLIILLVISLMQLAQNTYNPFIYFRF